WIIVQPSGGIPEREERSASGRTPTTIVRRSASHAFLDALRPLLKLLKRSSSTPHTPPCKLRADTC
ncbi:hypothetical protein DXU85_26020, partial [Pseudomonas savastanoi]